MTTANAPRRVLAYTGPTPDGTFKYRGPVQVQGALFFTSKAVGYAPTADVEMVDAAPLLREHPDRLRAATPEETSVHYFGAPAEDGPHRCPACSQALPKKEVERISALVAAATIQEAEKALEEEKGTDAPAADGVDPWARYAVLPMDELKTLAFNVDLVWDKRATKEDLARMLYEHYTKKSSTPAAVMERPAARDDVDLPTNRLPTMVELSAASSEQLHCFLIRHEVKPNDNASHGLLLNLAMDILTGLELEAKNYENP